MGSKSRARAKKSRSKRKNKGEIMPPVENTNKRQIVFRMMVEGRLIVF